MIKVISKIEPVTIGRDDSGRYEYKDFLGVTEAGDKAFRITIENVSENEYIYFKSRENADKFLAEQKV
jgi:hypothetical protein